MGKTTLYHPIPLSTLRGAAEYCGWKFGKIVQVWSDPERQEAKYRVEISVVPNVLVQDVRQYKTLLQRCFMPNIRVHNFKWVIGGKVTCTLIVQAPKSEPEPESSVMINPDDFPF